MKRTPHASLLAALLCLTASTQVRAQTISSTTLSASSYCLGDSIRIDYVAVGSFGAKNVFTAQLSDASGSFQKTFQNLASLKSTTSGSMTVATPEGVSGTHYRVRVIASIPYIVGPDNGSDLTIGSGPQFSYELPAAYVMANTAMQINAHPDPTVVRAHWDFGQDADPATAETIIPPPVTYSSTGPKTVLVTAWNALGCSYSHGDSVQRQTITVIDCNPSIPHDAFIDSTNDNQWHLPIWQNTFVWAVPGSECFPPPGHFTIFAEPGSTIHTPANGDALIYLKPGAVFIGMGSGVTIVRAPGASVTEETRPATIIECPTLDFDYSVAPYYKIITQGVNDGAARKPSVRVFPNPSANILAIQSEVVPAVVTLVDATGETRLSNEAVTSTLFSLDVSRLSAGAYRLILQYRDGHREITNVTVTH